MSADAPPSAPPALARSASVALDPPAGTGAKREATDAAPCPRDVASKKQRGGDSPSAARRPKLDAEWKKDTAMFDAAVAELLSTPAEDGSQRYLLEQLFRSYRGDAERVQTLWEEYGNPAKTTVRDAFDEQRYVCYLKCTRISELLGADNPVAGYYANAATHFVPLQDPAM
jgi:hypothetical protein